MPGRKSPLLLDADILIDFCGSDLSVLTLVARHLRPVRIVAPILREVPELDATTCDRHALDLWEPSTEQLLAAAAKRGPLSFRDRLCLIVARDEGWTCATNDKALRRECTAEGVRTRWGLELLIDLVEARRLETRAALGIATEIHLNNRHHISAAILARFEQRLRRSSR
jgi:predicted nucleic acid-binding protein